MTQNIYLSAKRVRSELSEENLLRLYHAYSNLTEESAWYQDATIEIKMVAEYVGLPWERFAAIVAAISPGKAWTTNISDAARMCDHWLDGGTELLLPGIGSTMGKGNFAKAWRIAMGGTIERHLTGPKVTAFHANLCGRTDVPTVDSHAIWAAMGSLERGPVKVSSKTHETIRNLYVKVATSLGITVTHLQAVVWTARKMELQGA